MGNPGAVVIVNGTTIIGIAGTKVREVRDGKDAELV